ncbi:MAG: hypothetical protein U0L98_01320 [Clostridia bacterium]|nr:hypothetical protein [Clostridia bacterium]
MGKLTKKTKVICLVLVVVIIAGIVVIATAGFNVELSMQKNNRVELYLEKDFEISDIKNIANEVFQNKQTVIQKVEVFGDTVSITTNEITDEQKQQLVEKVNGKYSLELTSDSIEIEKIPNERLRDLINPYIFAFSLATGLILVYMMLKYKKLGMLNILIKTLCTIVIAQVTLFSVIAITRIPVGRLTIPMVIVVYLVTLYTLTHNYENKLDKIGEENK